MDILDSFVQNYWSFPLVWRFSPWYQKKLIVPYEFIIERTEINSDCEREQSQAFQIKIQILRANSNRISKILPQIKVNILCETFRDTEISFVSISIEVLKGEASGVNTGYTSFILENLINSFANMKDYLRIACLEPKKISLELGRSLR